MQILPIRTPLIRPGDDIAGIIRSSVELLDEDIIVISSKAIATAEGATIDLTTLIPSDEAVDWSIKTGRSPAFMEAVLRETRRLHGTVKGSCPGALLTELRPEGMRTGAILCPNAGMDESNIQEGWAVGWPLDPVMSALQLREALMNNSNVEYRMSKFAVLVSDSCCTPRRSGVTAFALTVAGFSPLKSEIGNRDLFGRKLHITVEALADQLSTAANTVMGNTNQSTPAAIIRDHGVIPTEYSGWVDGIEPNDDLFSAIL